MTVNAHPGVGNSDPEVFAAGPVGIGAAEFILAAGSTMTAVMDYTGDAADAAAGTLALQTKIQIGENARLRLVQIHRG